MGVIRLFFPPFYKYPVILFAGFNLIFSAVVLSVSEAFYKLALTILPTAYSMFEDTKKKGADFDWTAAEQHQMEMYTSIMLILWALSAVGILLCMLIIIPQFFDFNDKRGDPHHMCFMLPRLAWLKFYIMIVYLLLLFTALVAAALICPPATTMFINNFIAAEKEEVYLTELEQKLECTTDDDKEVPDWMNCWKNVQMSFVREWWLDLLIIFFLAGNFICILLIPVLNKPLFGSGYDEENEKMLP